MEFELPEIPVYVLGALALVTPYAVALINAFADFTKITRRVVSVVVSLVLAAGVLAWYYYATGEAVPEWPVLLPLSVAVSQASYALVTKGTAAKLEDKVAVKVKTVAAGHDPGDNGHSVVPAENADGPTLEEVGGWTEEPFDLESYLRENVADDVTEPRRGDHAAD